MRHKKPYFCDAHATCATESHISMEHLVFVCHRIPNFCGAFKTMQHIIFLFCGALLFSAPQNAFLSISCFLVVYVSLILVLYVTAIFEWERSNILICG